MFRLTWLFILSVATFGSLSVWPLYAADWPTEGGGNMRLNATEERVSEKPHLHWTYQSPAVPRLAWSSAEGRTFEGKLLAHRIRFDDAIRTVIAQGRVYFGSSVDHQLHCRDLATGKRLWTFYTGGPIRLSPTIHEGNIYFGSDDGRAYCLDAETGKLRWQRQVAPRDEWILARGELISKWPVRTGLMVHNNVVYMGAGIFPHEDVYLYGVDPKTGRQVWQQETISALDAGRNDLSPQGYLLAKDDLLIVPSGGSLPAVFDVKENRLLHKRSHSWRANGVVGGTRALLADGQLYTCGEHDVLAMDERNGDIGFGWFKGRQMAIQGDSAYVLTGTKLSRINRLNYAVASRRRHELEEVVNKSGRELRNKEGAEADELRKTIQNANEELDQLADVGIVWSTETKDDMALLAAGNAILVGGPERVTAYAPDGGQVLWNYKLKGTVRSLAVAGGRLLVSTDVGAIHCFGEGDHPATSLADTDSNEFSDDDQSERYRDAAAEILKHAKTAAGYCLIVGSEEGRLALELARQSQLKIYCVEPSPEKTARARQRLSAAGLYGHRVAVHQHEFGPLPFSNYFADLIVSDTLLKDGKWPFALKDVERHLKPQGGMLILGRPAPQGVIPESDLRQIAATSQLANETQTKIEDGWLISVRGGLPGAGNWSHQYGNPGNTAVSTDRRIQGDLGVLWYGDPGPGEMLNRHDGAVGPLAVNGRLFVQGESTIMAYDSYNGRHLWTHENPKAIRTGVFQNQNPGNLAAGEDSLFHFIGDKCYQLDMATGQVVATHGLPMGKADGRYEWGYLAIHDGYLIGTATIRQEIAAANRRRGRATDDATDGLFAIDLKTGRHAWSYAGKSISHHTIALGPDRVFFIDSSITSEQREDLLKVDKSKLAELTGEEQRLAEERLKEADVRLAIALDLKTGEKLWEKAVDVTDCSDIGTGGGKLTLMYSGDTLILCGANANGHYWKQFVAGEFKRRRLVALSAYDGYKMWAKDANYRHRPIIIGKKLLAEPWMFDLTTGVQITREHPITGENVPWSIMRTGHHCGMLTGSESGMILFRSGATGFADLNSDDGIRHFAGHRLGCWINAIAANGLVMIPEASAGCVCQFSISSTVVLEPREERRPWTIYSAVGQQTPVERLAINLGAPGDRKDSLGQIWFSYPRRDAYQVTTLDVALDLGPQFAAGGDFKNAAEALDFAEAAETPWLYHSWAEGLQQLTLPLLSENDEPATYTVRLHFADCRTDAAEETKCDVLLNGQVAAADVTLPPPTEKAIHPKINTVRGVQVERNLLIELRAKQGTPLLSAIEVIRESK